MVCGKDRADRGRPGGGRRHTLGRRQVHDSKQDRTLASRHVPASLLRKDRPELRRLEVGHQAEGQELREVAGVPEV
ncbi:MAG: hypothetical protein PHZ19_09275 [Candidatus Thermoplasmatota archaeon]|nr:hypothetical protein [Candidatus Thermoplasmatota archaeon]